MARTLRRRWWLLLPVVLIVLAGGFVGWASLAAPPMPEAQAALQPDTQVTVSTGPWLVFQPTGQDPATGLIFTPADGWMPALTRHPLIPWPPRDTSWSSHRCR